MTKNGPATALDARGWAGYAARVARGTTMTEQEWAACGDPQKMLECLQTLSSGSAFLTCTCCRVKCQRKPVACPAYRKLRLFSHDCCRRILHLLPDPACRDAVDALEGSIEGTIDEGTYLHAYLRFDRIRRAQYPGAVTPADEAWTAVYCAVHRHWREQFDEYHAHERWQYAVGVAEDAAAGVGPHEKQQQSNLLREIFGNPFHPPSPLPAGVLAWNDATIRRVAEGIYQERAFERLGILADALLDAGCDDEELIGHCRSKGPHVRGCWGIDLILGRS